MGLSRQAVELFVTVQHLLHAWSERLAYAEPQMLSLHCSTQLTLDRLHCWAQHLGKEKMAMCGSLDRVDVARAGLYRSVHLHGREHGRQHSHSSWSARVYPCIIFLYPAGMKALGPARGSKALKWVRHLNMHWLGVLYHSRALIAFVGVWIFCVICFGLTLHHK